MIPIGSKINKKKNKTKANSDDDEEEEDDEDEENNDVVEDGEEVESISETNSDENNNNNDSDDLDELTATNNLTFDKIKVKLCDFSFSQVMTGNKILGMMGTVAYSAPEVLEYEALTKATDMW